MRQFFFFFALLLSEHAFAGSVLEKLFHNAAETYGVPVKILRAVCTHESQSYHDGKRQPWPWAVNISGKGYWFGGWEAAVNAAQMEIESGNLNVDIGLCQINWRWHGMHFSSVTDLINPQQNIRYAASYLAQQKKGVSWEIAVGRYHNPSNQLLAQRYAASVLAAVY